MTDTQTKITWEEHDEYDEGAQSTCGRFEALIDPIYGYFTLHAHGDTTESLGEHRSLSELAVIAERLLASGQVPAEAI